MDPSGRLELETLRRRVADGTIDTVVTALPDLYGRLVGKRITGRFFVEEVASHGMHVCDYLLACDMEMDPTPGYGFTNWASGYGDLHATPDLSTLRVADWHERTAVVLCDSKHAESGEPIGVAPRTILQHQIERARSAGFVPMMGSELEFYLFRLPYAAARASGYRELEPTSRYVEDYHVLSGAFAEPVIGAIRRHVDASGIPVEFSKGEWGPGQHEINLRYAAAQEMADRHVLYKLAAKEIAAAAGWSLTFMAKPEADLAGNSLHIHSSLWSEGGESSFAQGAKPLPGTPVEGSDLFRFYLGGLLAHACELAWFFAPNVNSYKRYRAGTFAPTRVAWSYDNRTAGFRVVGSGPSLRVECRIPGADANPYLAYAALLAAGLDGIERQLEPPPAVQGDVYAGDELPEVPRTLPDAIEALERSEFARKAFGDEVVDHLIHFARSEQRYFEGSVTDFERVRYFERI
jgi:glutamine synthetase